MAERRMLAKSIIDSDLFLTMPISTQNLYFHLSLRADDDGFVGNPKKIRSFVGASEDDHRILVAKRFVIEFASGVIVIRHWRIHNYIQKDRYKETIYTEEKSYLVPQSQKSRQPYELLSATDNQCIQNVSKMDTQYRLGKTSKGKDSIVYTDTNNKSKLTFGEYGWVKLTQEQYEKLKTDFPQNDIDKQIQLIDEYVQSNGNKNKYKDFNLVIRKSIRDGWFTKPQQQGKQTKPSKTVPEWFDKHLEEARIKDEERKKQIESNLLSLEELEEIFRKDK